MFVMLVKVAKELEALGYKFFWGGTIHKRKIAWVKWDLVMASLENGGLDIGSLASFNMALILKWKWRFFFMKMNLFG